MKNHMVSKYLPTKYFIIKGEKNTSEDNMTDTLLIK